MVDNDKDSAIIYTFGYWLRRYRTEILHSSRDMFAILLTRHADENLLKVINSDLIRRIEGDRVLKTADVAVVIARAIELKPEYLDNFVAFATGLLRLADSNFTPVAHELPPLVSVFTTSYAQTIMEFNFPEQVKIPCQQYLLYFVEFLRDVGIEATASLQELAGKTLFSVTPKDKDEALDKIREALDVYLHLPTSRTITPFYSPQTGIEVQRLSAQVLHLQSQLMLASAAYQQKELANQQQSVIIQQQQSLIQQQITSGQVLLASLQREADKDDAEPVGTDLVKIKPWAPEAVPIEVDLPTILRRLKEKFSRKQLPPGE